jgi:hypothetical protein
VTKSFNVSIVIASDLISLFGFSASLSLIASSTKTSQITVQSVNGVSDSVTLSAAWSGTQPAGTTFTLAPGILTVPSSGAPVLATLTVTNFASPSTGAFTLKITGTTATGVTRSFNLPVVITNSLPAATWRLH